MLESFLNAKPLYYDEIDYTRMPRVYEKIKSSIKLPKIIHLVGTNGKGTTGRFLASALFSTKHRVGHYTSPHISSFNERIWLNGSNVSDERLNSAHQELLELLSSEDVDALSYFEYTTLLAIYIFQDVEYAVMEAGLGGEHDATAVFTKVLSLITPIDFDHEAFLGSDIQSIATTKLRAVQNEAIVARQRHDAVWSVAKELQEQRGVTFRTCEALLKDEDRAKIEQIAQENHLATYLKENLSLAVSALVSLGIKYEVRDFYKSRLYGRLTELSSNILLDVGHNALAAQSIYESLKGTKKTLIYNTFQDKDYPHILEILKPIILDVEIITIEDERAESIENIYTVLQRLSIRYKKFQKLDVNKNYLVFGSFSVAQAFLKIYDE